MAPCKIAYFISPHGFGHATRSAAVLDALFQRKPDLHVVIFSKLPRFIFEGLPQTQISYVETVCDIGLVQKSATDIDKNRSIQVLNQFWPPRESSWMDCLAKLRAGRFTGVICDIAPVGIWLAEKADLPSILIENFTWDWIYRGLKPTVPALNSVADYLQELNARVGLHLQCEPFCALAPGAETVAPIVRSLRSSPEVLRAQVLGSKLGTLVLLTMGGLMETPASREALFAFPEITFLLPGSCVRERNVFGLGEGADFYHPDWVAAADIVLGKLGYSTAMEALQGGTPFAYVDRPDFPESAVLAHYLANRIPLQKVASLEPKTWLEPLRKLATTAKGNPPQLAGARDAAIKILNFLG